MTLAPSAFLLLIATGGMVSIKLNRSLPPGLSFVAVLVILTYGGL